MRGKLLIATVMIAAVAVSNTDTVKISIAYAIGETKDEAFSEREAAREEVIGGDREEQVEWREWDNEWLREFRDKFGNAAASDLKPLELDPLPSDTEEKEEEKED